MQRPFLLERYPGLAEKLPHVSLGERPSPVRPLRDLLATQTSLWVKDDGLFGTLYGGNKVRKLEWILPEAQRRRARSLFTWGGLGTNWGLAAALYGAQYKLNTVISLVEQPVNAAVAAHIAKLQQNAKLHFHGSMPRAACAAPAEIFRCTLSDRRFPYIVRPGGSSALGVVGYVDVGLEIGYQVRAGALPQPSHVVVAVGSGGTAAGLVVGLRLAGLDSRIVGVVVAHQLKRERAVVRALARRATELLRRRGAEIPERLAPGAGGFETTRAWMGAGYGHKTPETEHARMWARERAGLTLDPVYTAKAMAALRALDERGYFGRGPILFLNTHDSLSNASSSASRALLTPR